MQTPTLIGGFRKLDWPPVALHRMQDPPYAESEITIEPYPPLAGEPTRICVELRNTSDEPQTVNVGFEVSQQLGIGLPFTPIDQQLVTIPPHDTVKVCTMWVPPRPDTSVCRFSCSIHAGFTSNQISQRNLDVNEVLLPGVDAPLVFPVRNPNPYPTVITMSADARRFVLRRVLRPADLPARPRPDHRPVTAHRDTPAWPYAGAWHRHRRSRSEVRRRTTTSSGCWAASAKNFSRPFRSINRAIRPTPSARSRIEPYPPRAGEPTQICVELRNPTDMTQTIEVEFAIANFGIGLPFTPIPRPDGHLAAAQQCEEMYDVGAAVCRALLRAGQLAASADSPAVVQRSQRNIDVGEVFEPGQWTQPFVFPVGNPSDQPTNIEVAAIPHLPEWQISLTPTLLLNMQPHEVRPVTLTVRPPIGVPFPEDDTPIVDVEAHAQGELIGGFRKIYRPPVPDPSAPAIRSMPNPRFTSIRIRRVNDSPPKSARRFATRPM